MFTIQPIFFETTSIVPHNSLNHVSSRLYFYRRIVNAKVVFSLETANITGGSLPPILGILSPFSLVSLVVSQLPVTP